MTTIVTRAGKGTPLTNTEVDSNFTNLNSNKLELGQTFSAATANAVLYFDGSKIVSNGSALTFSGSNLVVGGTISETVSSTQYLVASQYDVGTNPNQIPLNQYLGDMAFQSSAGVSVGALTASGAVTLSGGTANGVVYLNASKVATSGTALTYDGTTLATRVTASGTFQLAYSGTNLTNADFNVRIANNLTDLQVSSATPLSFTLGASEQMRLTTSGLEIKQSQLIGYSSFAGIGSNGLAVLGNVGIGTNAPSAKLQINSGSDEFFSFGSTGAGWNYGVIRHVSSGDLGYIGDGVSAVSGGANTDLAIRAQQGGLLFATNGNNIRATLDSSGNLGLGVTPSAWSSSLKALEILNSIGTGSIASGFGSLYLLNNVIFDGAFKYKANGKAARLQFDENEFKFYTAASGTAGATTSITSGQVYQVTTLGSTTLGQWQAYFSALTGIPSIGQTVTATATGTLAGGATVTQIISFTQAMTLDASANLLVGGTSTLSSPTLNKGVYLQSSTNNDIVGYSLYVADGANSRRGSFFLDDNAGLCGLDFTASSIVPDMVFRLAGEKARITSGGYFKASSTGSYVSSTSTYHELRNDANANTVRISNSIASGYTDAIIQAQFSAYTPNAATAWFLFCDDTTNQKAGILSTGTFESRTSTYGGVSDVKLKTNIVDANSQWNDLKAVRVRNFAFKDEPNTTMLGVVAQEIEEVSPGLVYETPDRDKEGNDLGTTTKSVKYSILYMKAIKALQEAMARIETLEAKIAVLESKGV